MGSTPGSLPFKLSSLLCLLHWDTEELSKNDLCLPHRREVLGQSGVTPVSPTFSPTGTRRMEKFISQFTPTQRKPPVPQSAEAKTIFARRKSKKRIRSKRERRENCQSELEPKPIPMKTGELRESRTHETRRPVLITASNFLHNQQRSPQVAKGPFISYLLSLVLGMEEMLKKYCKA